jgi:hypothetical protein
MEAEEEGRAIPFI